MHRRRGLVWLAVPTLVAVGVSSSWADGGRQKVGDVRSYAAETPHPYPKTWLDRVYSPGAEFIRVHFTGLQLADGDSMTVSSTDHSQVWTYSKRGTHGTGDDWQLRHDGHAALT